MAGTTLRLELAEGGQAMVAVGRPVEAGLRRHRHDRVDEAVELLHRLGEALGVGGGEVALVGCRLHLLPREQDEELPVVAHGLAVDREHRAAVLLDLGREGGRLLRGLLVARVDAVGHVRHQEWSVPSSRRATGR